ncbi:MAG TPA: acyltransferase family protein [Microbacterium sp.]|uniref:acyltransferase family protein n=1 Tax=Microbacterium sp. TaxID=51671 RepID=UPI002C69B63C|nr:acyltransferase family protein [Microbacterium sp.]HWI30267.1 acyltransferase family protein [Microbacterium sp.]
MAPSGTAVARPRSMPGTPLSPNVPGRTAERRDIQGLRAVAVVVVILDHFLGWPAGGFIGVDVFFVLSGFLITGLLLREYERNGRISIADFYRRRVRRILPVSLLVLGLTVVAGLLLFSPVRAASTLVDAFWTLIFGINWHLAIVGTDYMQAAGPVSPLRHYWSLAVEEQFYVVWPMIIIAVFAIAAALMRRRPAVAGRDDRAAGRRGLLIAAVVVVVASFAWSLYESVAMPSFAYFSTFSRAWELGLGALLAVTAPYLVNLSPLVRTALAWVGLAGIAASLFVISPASVFPAPWAALPVLATVLVLMSGVGTQARGIGILTNRVSTYVGDISYSLYLWHWPIFVFAGVLIPTDTPIAFAGMLALTTLLSVFSYHFLEDPVRRSSFLEPRWRRVAKRRAQRPGGLSARAIGLGWLGALAVVTVVMMAFAMTFAAVLKTPPAAIVVEAAPAAGSETLSLQEQRTAEIATALSATAWPATDPSLDTLGKEAGAAQWVNDDCLNIYSNARDSCVYGDPASEKLAVLLGDSTAISYLPALIGPMTEAGYRIQVLTMFSCPAYDIAVGPVGSEAAKVCDLQHGWVYDYVAQLRPDMVLMSTLAGSVVKLASGTNDATAVTEYQDAAAATLATLSPSVGEIVVISPPPANEKPVTECKTPTNGPAACVYKASALYRSVLDAERAAVATLPEQARYIDVSPWLCNAGSCPQFIGTTPVSWDGIHLTDKASGNLAPLFKEALFATAEDSDVTAGADG